MKHALDAPSTFRCEALRLILLTSVSLLSYILPCGDFHMHHRSLLEQVVHSSLVDCKGLAIGPIRFERLQDEIMQEIVSLIDKSNALDTELKEELAKAEDALYRGHVIGAELSRHELQLSQAHVKADASRQAEPAASERQ